MPKSKEELERDGTIQEPSTWDSFKDLLDTIDQEEEEEEDEEEEDR